LCARYIDVNYLKDSVSFTGRYDLLSLSIYYFIFESYQRASQNISGLYSLCQFFKESFKELPTRSFFLHTSMVTPLERRRMTLYLKMYCIIIFIPRINPVGIKFLKRSLSFIKQVLFNPCDHRSICQNLLMSRSLGDKKLGCGYGFL
jgi:hypothetical protein